jgi:hypothetical protein
MKAMSVLPLIAMCCFSLADAIHQSGTGGSLKKLSLEQLGDVEVIAASKEPEEIWQTPAAISVITREDILRSGATAFLKFSAAYPVCRWPEPTPAPGRSAFAGLPASSRNQFSF